MRTGPTGNRLLDALPVDVAQRLQGACAEVDLPVGTALFGREERPRYLHFLTGGIASIVFSSERGNSVELSAQGSEGMIGWSFLLGPVATLGESMMQVHGRTFRIPIEIIQHEFATSTEVRNMVLAYAQHQINLANQILACNRLHRAEARFSRWLLMVADRICSPELPMTQEYMSMLLGTRRTTVAEVSAQLARAGAVEGRRGGLRIIDRAALEAHACECYPILRRRFDALFQVEVQTSSAPCSRAAL